MGNDYKHEVFVKMMEDYFYWREKWHESNRNYELSYGKMFLEGLYLGKACQAYYDWKKVWGIMK